MGVPPPRNPGLSTDIPSFLLKIKDFQLNIPSFQLDIPRFLIYCILHIWGESNIFDYQLKILEYQLRILEYQQHLDIFGILTESLGISSINQVYESKVLDYRLKSWNINN